MALGEEGNWRRERWTGEGKRTARGVGGGGVTHDLTGGDAASEEASDLEWGGRVDLGQRDVGDDNVLREAGAAHEVEDALSLHVPVPARLVGHDALALGGANLDTKVGLGGLAEQAVTALGGVEGNDVVADGKVGDALANALDDASALDSNTRVRTSAHPTP